MSANRERYGEQQAALLRALRTGENPPPGFAIDDLTAASRALIDKRARAVAQSWPALTHALGNEFPAAFEHFARNTPPPVAGDGFADGLAFASSLDPAKLTDDAEAERLLARGSLKLTATQVAPRRGIFLGARKLAHPRRMLIVFHLPLLGLRHATLRVPTHGA